MEQEQPSSVESFGYKQELKRSLTLTDLLIYGLIFIVPGAPVAVFGIVYNASHGMPPWTGRPAVLGADHSPVRISS